MTIAKIPRLICRLAPTHVPYMHSAQAIDALALCDVDGRMFLEMDEEDLAESDELGLDVGAVCMTLRISQAKWLVLRYHCSIMYRACLLTAASVGVGTTTVP